jgi:hypothetical protein
MKGFDYEPRDSPHELKQSSCLLAQYYEGMVLLSLILCLAFVQINPGVVGAGAKVVHASPCLPTSAAVAHPDSEV